MLLAVAGGLLYWFMRGAPDKPVAVSLPPPEDVSPVDSGPRYPLPVESLVDKPAVQPLPGLDASDDYLRMDVGRVFGTAIAELLVNQALIERIVATVDSLPRSQIAGRIRPVKSLESPFAVVGQDDSGEYQLGADNYSRYDAIVARLQAVDVAQMVELYRRYYPLFQKAYEGLGYPNAYFNDRLVEVLDHLLTLPEPGDSVALVRPNVLYLYADADLEAQSSGRKLLIRMGPAHRQSVLAVVRDFREQVAFSN